MTPSFVDGADRSDMGREPFLFGMHKIRRQKQNAVRARTFGGSGQLLRDGRTMTGRGDHRHAAFRFGHRHRHHFFDLRRRQREELAGTARGEQSRNIVTAKPIQILSILPLIEAEICRKRRYREG